jgi:competence protein ComEA
MSVRFIRQLIAVVLATLSLAAAAAVDANKASQAELESVKGVGPALSGKIIAARQKAAFKDWSDMVDRVAGMGPGNAARLSQNGLTVAGSAYAAPGAAKAEAADSRKPGRERAAAGGKPITP